jgi:hypothetical protein
MAIIPVSPIFIISSAGYFSRKEVILFAVPTSFQRLPDIYAVPYAVVRGATKTQDTGQLLVTVY